MFGNEVKESVDTKTVKLRAIKPKQLAEKR